MLDKKMAIEADKMTADNIYKVLIYFDKLYSVMNEQEKRQLIEALISEVQIYEERQPNGQWLKSIKFRLPIISEDMDLGLDNDTHVETVCLLVRTNGLHIDIDVDVEEMLQEKRGQATYAQIKKYVLEQNGFKVSSLYISQVKRKCGLDVSDSYNKPKSEDAIVPQCPPKKEEAIMNALRHFGMI